MSTAADDGVEGLEEGDKVDSRACHITLVPQLGSVTRRIPYHGSGCGVPHVFDSALVSLALD